MSGRAGTAGVFIAACEVDVGSYLLLTKGRDPKRPKKPFLTHLFFLALKFEGSAITFEHINRS